MIEEWKWWNPSFGEPVFLALLHDRLQVKYPEVAHVLAQSLGMPEDAELRTRSYECFVDFVSQHFKDDPKNAILAYLAIPCHYASTHLSFETSYPLQGEVIPAHARWLLDLAREHAADNPDISCGLLNVALYYTCARGSDLEYNNDILIGALVDILAVVKKHRSTNPQAALRVIETADGNWMVDFVAPHRAKITGRHTYDLFHEALGFAEECKDKDPETTLRILRSCIGHGEMNPNQSLYAYDIKKWHETADKIKEIATYLGQNTSLRDNSEMQRSINHILTTKQLNPPEEKNRPSNRAVGAIIRFFTVNMGKGEGRS